MTVITMAPGVYEILCDFKSLSRSQGLVGVGRVRRIDEIVARIFCVHSRVVLPLATCVRVESRATSH